MSRPRKEYSVRKKRYTNAAGQKVESKAYYIHFRDHFDIQRKIEGTSDKSTSGYIGKNLSAIVNLRAGNQPLTAELRRFIESRPAAFRKVLMKWRILDEQTVSGFEPLMRATKKRKPRSSYVTYVVTAGHLYEWMSYMQSIGKNKGHVQQAVQHIAKIIDGCGFIFPSEMNGEKILQFITKTMKSPQTGNHWLTSIKTFDSWMLKTGRISVSALAHISPIKALEKTRSRRVLTMGETVSLLSATEGASPHHGCTGRERVLIYMLALYTGLRSKEIYTLPRFSFKLKENTATVTILAKDAKSKKGDVLPLKDDLARVLHEYFLETPAIPTAYAFPRGWKNKAAEMLRQDLTAAGVVYEAEDGVADFHALRHTFCTNLARSGVMPQDAQRLMRHASIETTFLKTLYVNPSKTRGISLTCDF